MNKIVDHIEVSGNEHTTEFEKKPPEEYGYGVRHVQVLLGFMNMFVFYIVRTHIGVTIVAMTSNETVHLNVTSEHINDAGNESRIILLSPKLYYETENNWNIFQSYNWTKPQQEVILSSFSIGLLIMLVPVGLVCQRLGGKLLLQVALLINVLCNIPLPWLTLVGGWPGTAANRLLQGMTYATLNPGMHTIIGNWIPGSERGRVTNFVYAGSSLGTVIAHQLSGILSETILGWPSVFWFIGITCAFTYALLTFFGASTPSDHKTITEAEKLFIISQVKTKKKRRVPWRQIMSSRYAWAAFATQVGTSASFTFCLTQVPTYMHNVLGISVKNSGLLTSLPFVVKFFVSFLYGYLTDMFAKKKLLSTINSRRLFNSIAEVGVTACLTSVSFTQNTTLAVTLFILSMTAHAAMQSGWMLTYIDLSPNYSGFLIATGSTLAQVFNGLVLPSIVAYVVKDLKNQFQWRIMFLTVASMSFFCNLIYVTFVSAEIQEWNDYGEQTDTKNTQEFNETIVLNTREPNAVYAKKSDE